jgi:hypothetical protein
MALNNLQSAAVLCGIGLPYWVWVTVRVWRSGVGVTTAESGDVIERFTRGDQPRRFLVGIWINIVIILMMIGTVAAAFLEPWIIKLTG